MTTIIKRVLFIFLLLLTLNTVLADGFKNSIVNITFSKDLSGNVHINLISEKPYNNQLVVTKRAENRYIILLPEFDNKILPISDFGNLSDTISNISISTIPYTDTGIKGYTKISISTYNNVNIIATTSLKTNNPIVSELINNSNTSIPKEVKQVSKSVVQISTPKSEKKVIKKIIKKNDVSVKRVKTNINSNNVVKNYSAPLKTKNVAVKNITPVKQIAVNDKLSVEPTILNKENKLSDNEIKQQTINSESKIQKTSLFISLINYIHSLGYKKTILLLSAIVFPIFVLFFIIFMNKKLKKKISNENYNNSQVEADNSENIVDEPQAEVSNIQSFEDESQTNSVVTENFDDYEDTVNSEDNIIEADSNIVIEENDENYSSVEKSDEELLEEQSILSNSDASFSEIISNDNLNENTEEETDVSVDNDIIEESFEEPVADYTDSIHDNILSEDVPEITEVESQDDELEQIEFVQEYEEYEPEGSLSDFSSVDDSVFDNIQAINDDNVFEDLRNEYETTDEGLIILNQTKINETSGFYLVNLDNHSSLIGYINEEIFVIKTFDEFVNEEIFVRQSEQLSETCIRYIVKVGLYKMVVDVTGDSMLHVIDL